MKDRSEGPAALILSPFFYPENISTGRYNTHLALALNEAGYDVTTVCSYPFYPEWRVDKNGADELSGIRILRGGRRLRYPRSQILRRLILEIWFYFFTRKAVRILDSHKFDVVIDIYPPNLFALSSSRRRRVRAPVIGVVHDLQGVMSQTKKSIPRRLIGRLIHPIEKKALKQCDHLIFLSNAMLQFALDRYALNPDICDVVYPFQSLSGVRSQKVPAVLIPHEKTLVYSGALGEKQAPEELLKLLDAFARRNRDYHAIVFSDGPIFESLKEQYRASGSPVEFHGLVPDDELEGLLRSSTIQVIPQKLSVSHGAFPSKLPNIIAADTAIFGVTDAGSEVDDILSQYSRGKAVNNWNLNESLDSLEAFAYKLASDTEVPGAENEDAELKSLFRVERLCEVINEVAKIRTKFSSERD